MTAPHPTPDAQRIAELTVEFFRRAGRDAMISERMSFADTVVHVHFAGASDAESASCTLYLDRHPIGAELGCPGPAEVELTGPVEKWWHLISGEGRIPLAILAGELTYRGPVRKFLRVTPMLSNFDYGMWDAAAPAVSAGTGT